jgi:hypothetical protein
MTLIPATARLFFQHGAQGKENTTESNLPVVMVRGALPTATCDLRRIPCTDE